MTLNKLLLVILLWAPSGLGNAAELIHYSDWSDKNKRDFWLSNAGMMLDWATTRDMAGKWDTCQCKELNPILGDYPSRSRVDNYMLANIALNYLFAASIPVESDRSNYLQLRAGLHAAAGLSNAIQFEARWHF